MLNLRGCGNCSQREVESLGLRLLLFITLPTPSASAQEPQRNPKVTRGPFVSGSSEHFSPPPDGFICITQQFWSELGQGLSLTSYWLCTWKFYVTLIPEEPSHRIISMASTGKKQQCLMTLWRTFRLVFKSHVFLIPKSLPGMGLVRWKLSIGNLLKWK